MEVLNGINREVTDSLEKMHQRALSLAQKGGFVTGSNEQKKVAKREPSPLSVEELHQSVVDHMKEVSEHMEKMAILEKALKKEMGGKKRGSFKLYNGLPEH